MGSTPRTRRLFRMASGSCSSSFRQVRFRLTQSDGCSASARITRLGTTGRIRRPLPRSHRRRERTFFSSAYKNAPVRGFPDSAPPVAGARVRLRQADAAGAFFAPLSLSDKPANSRAPPAASNSLLHLAELMTVFRVFIVPLTIVFGAPSK